jgi:hypothetical protein
MNIAINNQMSCFVVPDTSTKIDITYKDKKTAAAIQRAITPDNVGAPEGMHIITNLNGNSLEIEVYSERSIGSLISTLDDLLSCIQAAEKTIEELEGNNATK